MTKGSPRLPRYWPKTVVRFTLKSGTVALAAASVLACRGEAERAVFHPTTPLPTPTASGVDWLAYTSSDEGRLRVRVVNRFGAGLRDLSVRTTPSNSLASWSPDGLRIAFASAREGTSDIFVMNKDGSNQIRLTEDPADDAFPAWSPDGSRIAFASTRDGGSEIYVMNEDGSDQFRLTSSPGGDISPAWSPDSARITFEYARREFRDIRHKR